MTSQLSFVITNGLVLELPAARFQVNSSRKFIFFTSSVSQHGYAAPAVSVKRSLTMMNVRSVPSRYCCNLTLAILCWAAPALLAQSGQPRQHLRSHLYIYDLRSGASREVFAADAIWEAPNWSP